MAGPLLLSRTDWRLVMRADRILVIDNGSIVESGSHQELLNTGGAYSRMHNQWQEKVRASGS